MSKRVAKQYWEGTHRLISPRETLDRVRPFLPKKGIPRLANVTGLDSIGIPVVMACRPNSRSLAVSQGKGCDSDAAKASAAMEAIEAYHAENVPLPRKFASYGELRAGFDRVVAVDLTLPDFGIPVVRVIVPEMERVAGREPVETYVGTWRSSRDQRSRDKRSLR